MNWLAVILACQNTVAAATLANVIDVESGGVPLAVHVNGVSPQPPQPSTVAEATALARLFIGRGYSVDLGLTQINSRNLPDLGLSVADVLDPCTNVRAGAAILTADYAAAAERYGPGQPALLAALSAYNTGDMARGFRNGYVARYTTVQSKAPTALRSVRPPDPYSADTTVTGW